jgi:ubiquinone/menaquinone biosynthesis C-methylase UbiE
MPLWPFRRVPRAVPLAEIKRFFEQAAGDEQHYPSAIDERILHVRVLADFFAPLPGARLADIGSGKGRFARIFAARGARVTAVDLSENMLAAARPLDACCASMTALPLATGVFDGAYATESLEHAVDIEAAVAELCRIVRPGGRVAIIDKNRAHWGRFETPVWEQWFGRRQLTRLLERHCARVTSRELSYWEDERPDGLFLAWLAVR